MGAYPAGPDASAFNNDLEKLGLPFCYSDSVALVALYFATDGPNWTDNSNWLSDAPIGDWYGVTTDAYGLVTELNLTDNGLKGEIPLELVNLSNLERLQLAGNALTGCVPNVLRDVPANDLEELGLPFC